MHKTMSAGTPTALARCVFVAAALSLCVVMAPVGAEARELPVPVCNHDEVQGMISRLVTRSLNEQERKYLNENNETVRGPLRVKPDYGRLYDDAVQGNSYICKKVDEMIIANGRQFKCTKEDIPTNAQRQYVKILMDRVKTKLLKLLQVDQVQEAWHPQRGVYGVVDVGVLSSEETDLWVFVTMRPSSASVYATGQILAYDQNGRTIFGLVNWNPRNLDPEAGKDAMYESIALHEMMHVLGFSQNRLLAFRNATTGERYQEQQVAGDTYDGREVTLLTSPRVVEEFRKQFGCDTAVGAILEDQGGSGTAGSHWEKSIFMDEFMTGVASERPVLSAVTLALLEDSGWYYPNYSMAEHLAWGYKKGCPFVTNRCNTGWPTGEGYFCSVQGEAGCSYDRAAIGSCEFRSWSTIPTKYQYFEEPRKGGPIEIADYCPFTYPTFYCDGDIAAQKSSYGDVVGNSSRCFMSKLSNIPLLGYLQPMAPKCYPHHCVSRSTLAVQLGSYWYVCPDGGNISHAVNFVGTLFCPQTDILCGTLEKEDTLFPIFTSIEPTTAKAGDVLRIRGKHLSAQTIVTVGAACQNVTYDPVTDSINCTIAKTSAFSTQVGPKNVVLKQNGYSIAIPNVFMLDINLQSWLVENWFFAFAIILSALLLLLTILTLICKIIRTKRAWKKYQKNRRKAAARERAAAKEASSSRNGRGGDIEMV